MCPKENCMQPVAMPFIYKFCIIYAISVNVVIIVYNLRISEDLLNTGTNSHNIITNLKLHQLL